MTIRQTRDLEFTILDSGHNPVKILIGLYNVIGPISAWSIWMSVPTETGGWKKIVDWPITGGQFRAYNEVQAAGAIRSFVTVVNGALSRIYGDLSTVDIPDDDPTTESREEFWVRLLDELLRIRNNRLAVRTDQSGQLSADGS